MLDTRKRHFLTDEDPDNTVAAAIAAVAKDHRVLATWDADGYTLWWQEEEAIDPLQVW